MAAVPAMVAVARTTAERGVAVAAAAEVTAGGSARRGGGGSRGMVLHLRHGGSGIHGRLLRRAVSLRAAHVVLLHLRAALPLAIDDRPLLTGRGAEG